MACLPEQLIDLGANVMKSNRKTVEKRWQRIVTHVNRKGEVSVEELTRLCQVSPMTVRRDLKVLEERGLLEHRYGKVLSLEGSWRLNRKDPSEQEVYRESIAAYAAGLLKDGDNIFINGSRTALSLLNYVEDKKISVRTNNGWAIDGEYPRGVSIHLIGGELYEHVMIGEYVVQNLLNMSADKTFIGCAAVFEDGEFRYDIPTEIGINEMMIAKTTGELYVLADHSKLARREDNRPSLYGSCRYNCDVTLITDEKADPEILAGLRLAGIKVIKVPVTA